MIGCTVRAERIRRLEYGNALALRAHPACLTMVGTSFCNDKTSPRLRRQMLKIFEHMLDLNRQVTPPCPTPFQIYGRRSFATIEEEVGHAGL